MIQGIFIGIALTLMLAYILFKRLISKLADMTNEEIEAILHQFKI